MTKLYREAKTLTEEEVQQAARYWQNRLSLNDWIIQAFIERKEDLPEETEALINYNLNKKHARISVLHPDQADGDEEHDMEALIVHELLHLHFAPLGHEEDADDPHPLETVALEQAVEAITRTIIVSERDKVVRFSKDKDDQLRKLAQERDTYREQMLRLQHKVDRLEKVIKDIREQKTVAMQSSSDYRQGEEEARQRNAERIGFGNLRKELTAAFSVPASQIQMDDEPPLYEEPDDGA